MVELKRFCSSPAEGGFRDQPKFGTERAIPGLLEQNMADSQEMEINCLFSGEALGTKEDTK
jgi:hypothetical protein